MFDNELIETDNKVVCSNDNNAGKVLMVIGISRYGVLVKACYELKVGFECRGYDVIVLDYNDNTKDNTEFIANDNSTYEFMFCMQAVIQGMDEELYRYNKVPRINWVVDDILYHYMRMDRIDESLVDMTYFFTVDYEMINVARQLFDEGKNIYYLPHGGFYSDNNCNKDIDVLYPGSLYPEKKWSEFAEDIMPIEKKIAGDAIGILEDNPEYPVRTAVKKALLNYGVDTDDNAVMRDLTYVIGYVDHYIRRKYRIILLRKLLENNIRVHVAGSDYSEFKNEFGDEIVLYGYVDINEVVDMMGRSKIVMNALPPVFLKGFHERIFTGMLTKSCVFTPCYAYGKETLGNRCFWIDMKNLDGMLSDVNKVINNYDDYRDMIDDNYMYALKHHTWKRRGEQIIDFYENHVIGGRI